jgi:hypothetical protein
MESVAKGTELWVENTGSPQSYIKVGHVISASYTESNVLVEVTDFDDAHVRNIASGVKDTQLQVVYNDELSQAGQVEMDAAQSDGLQRNFRLIDTALTPDRTRTFTAIVESIATAPALKGVIGKTVTFKVNSAMVVS